jgi:hypothetical protein
MQSIWASDGARVVTPSRNSHDPRCVSSRGPKYPGPRRSRDRRGRISPARAATNRRNAVIAAVCPFVRRARSSCILLPFRPSRINENVFRIARLCRPALPLPAVPHPERGTSAEGRTGQEAVRRSDWLAHRIVQPVFADRAGPALPFRPLGHDHGFRRHETIQLRLCEQVSFKHQFIHAPLLLQCILGE